MIYKAFLNRQEITGFPVKGKETSEIWGGDTLLWKKEEQIKEAFTVDSYHIVATVTNGKVFASKITIEGVNNKRLYGYALFNTQNPYTDIKVYQQQAAKGTIIDTKLFTEYGKSIYVAEIKGYYITYANMITSFDITIYDITSKATSAIKLTISASEENTAYDEPLLTDMWIKGGYIYFHALLDQYDGSVSDSYSNVIEKREQVFKINLNGGIIGKYERIYDKNVGEVPVSGIANTVINSNGKYYFVKKGDVYIREIPENPFDISSKLISGKRYIGTYNGKLIYISSSRNESKIYEFINDNFVEIRTIGAVTISTYFERICIYNNHIYATNYSKPSEIMDYGDIETGVDADAVNIGTLPYTVASQDSVELMIAQKGRIYIFQKYSDERVGAEASVKHYMTVVPLKKD